MKWVELTNVKDGKKRYWINLELILEMKVIDYENAQGRPSKKTRLHNGHNVFVEVEEMPEAILAL